MIYKPNKILHVTTFQHWSQFKNYPFYESDSLQNEGFIHNCTKEQLLGVIGRHFASHQILMLLEIDTSKLVNPLRMEESYPGDWYPHLYGSLNKDAITKIIPMEADSFGSFTMPDNL
ncbi:MAG: hypothetical protein CL763_00525 [Chloroflexi bacterium]|nr:hypothetical protein [Chloroflexota bacterium]|tara:strand:- start:17751 stop:18101 length:351 start_codon:yes stop_codon:yes gene_type:complete